MPTAGRGGWQCPSGPDPLPQQLPTWGHWGGEGGVPKALVMGALMLRAHLPKRHGVEASPLGLGQGKFSPAEVGRALQESRHSTCRGQAPVQPSLLEISIGPGGPGSDSEGMARGTKRFSSRQGKKCIKATSTAKRPKSQFKALDCPLQALTQNSHLPGRSGKRFPPWAKVTQ